MSKICLIFLVVGFWMAFYCDEMSEKLLDQFLYFAVKDIKSLIPNQVIKP